ncbi:MAG: DsbC family protein [Curvibacter sp.]|nr:MAG: DsbC family protein [Curvibacter sp.]
MKTTLIPRLLLAALPLLSLGAIAQEAVIKKALAARIPQLQSIDEVRKTPMNGLYEVRVGNDLFYTDAKGNYLIQGELIDTAQQRNLTEERIAKITAVDFSALPLSDAFTIVRGNGQRKIAVFEDPNCGYCKRFEKDLSKVDNVTVYMFLYPILGPDSADKARNHWCAKDKSATWLDWMVREKAAPNASCDVAAIARNVDFGRKYKITGTPTIIFSDGSRVPGALNTQQIEQRIAQAATPAKE